MVYPAINGIATCYKLTIADDEIYSAFSVSGLYDMQSQGSFDDYSMSLISCFSDIPHLNIVQSNKGVVP